MSGTPDIKELFNDLIELPDDARRAHLDRRCGDDTALRERVEALLQAYQTAGALLADPTIGQHAGLHAPGTAPEAGQMIGPYQLLERVGEGGFGEVWTAEQSAPVRRRVAIKVIKAGMDTREVLARFEAERQALALMDHPNIARVIDAGAIGPVQTPVNGVCGSETTTSPPAAGRPYFVMEHVAGIPITEYCDAGRLPIRRRLALFAQVCDAVQHAHGKGIIHRDLKPSNILVTPDERGAAAANGFGVPKVIDFGIAKATTTPLTERTLLTAPGGLMGTPAYMSPEQAGSSGVDVDTRSDVYSLGVILYQLLTGTLPFEPRMLREADHATLVKIIRDLEPPRPSTRLSTLAGERVNQHGGATPKEIAAQRDVEFSTLQRQLRGELDWVVMKCLEKDRTRRYETAHALALDVERYLKNEPVQAGPPSRVYHFRKFVRRNRAAVTAAALVSAALLAGMGGTTFGLLRAEERREEAERARAQLEQVSDFQAAMLRDIDVEAMGRGIKDYFREQVRAGLARQYVGEGIDRRPRVPEEVDGELAVFDERSKVARGVDVARRVMDEFVLARAADAMNKQFADQPLVQAQLHDAIGQTYEALGLYHDAEQHLLAALEIYQAHYGTERAEPHVMEAMCQLSTLMDSLGRRAEAEALARDVLGMSRALNDQPHVAKTLEKLATVLTNQRRFEEADARFREALPLIEEHFGADDELMITALNNLSVLRFKQGRHADAEELARRVLAWRREHFGEVHSKVVAPLSNLGYDLALQGKHEEAEARFREALAVAQAVYGDEHPTVAKCLYSLGMQLARVNRSREAEDLYRRALAQQRRLLGDDHADVRLTLGVLADLRSQSGDHDEAVVLLREALAIAERIYPDGNPEAFRRYSVMMRLGGALRAQARAVLEADRERALALMREAEPLSWRGFVGLDGHPQKDPVAKRGAAESIIADIEFWRTVDPQGDWDDRAVKWRAELEEIEQP